MYPVNDRLPMLCRLPSILQLDRRADYKNNETVQRKEKMNSECSQVKLYPDQTKIPIFPRQPSPLARPLQ